MDNIPQATPQKQCAGPCGRTLPATPEFFHRCKGKKDRLSNQCKECAKTRSRDWKKTHKTRISEIGKAYYQANKAEIDKKNKAYVDTHTERLRGYGNQYYHAHREKRIASRRRYSKTEQGRMRILANLNKRRARKRAIEGTLTPQQIQTKLKAQRYRCYYAACGHAKFEKRNGRYVFHLEHTIPTSRTEAGPRHDINYVVLACPSCNMKKGTKLPHEFFEGGRLF